jgi:hypothetical protein
LAAALLWVPVSVSATPIVYNFTSGQVTASASIISGSTITPIQLNGSPSVTVGLTGTSVTFDTAVSPGNALPAFSFVTSATGTLNLSPAVGTVTTVSLSALSVGPGTGYASSVVGSGPYNFNAGPITSSGTISLNGGAFNAFTANTPTATGQVNLGVNELDLNGITLWQRNLGGGQFLVIKGDFVFHGVPEPGLAVLIVCAGAVLAASRRRQ